MRKGPLRVLGSHPALSKPAPLARTLYWQDRRRQELKSGGLWKNVARRRWTNEDEALAAEAVRGRRLSARGLHRVLRVARTVADLAGACDIRTADLAFALLLRAEA